MSVYVDDMQAGFGRMKMCHMIADTDDELHAMAARIGVARKWHQDKSSRSHYDIALSRRILAVEFGAVEITLRQCAKMNMRRLRTGKLGSPEDADAWFAQHLAERREPQPAAKEGT